MTRGSITKRGRSSWQLRFDTAPINGKRKRRHVTVHGSFKTAQKELTRLLRSTDDGTLLEPTLVTVGAYVTQWLDSAREQSPKTLERYGQLGRCQVLPYLGELGLQKLRAEHLQRWHKDLIESGLAARSAVNAHKFLDRVLADAVKHGTLARNVCKLVKPPRVEAVEVKILAPGQIAEVLAKLEGHMLHPIVSLALATGMRRGELCGLQWADTDLDAGTIRVERSLEETQAGGLRLKSPKTRRARRNITLPADAISVLRAHRVKQLELRLAIGLGKIEPTTHIFSDENGEPLKPHLVSHRWQRVVVTKGLPRVTFHALRHSHVSALINARVDILTISRRVGHSNASITSDVYGHLIEGADAAAARAIEGVLK